MSGIATAIVGAAAVGAGASYISGKNNAKAIGDASDTSADAANYAADLQYQMWEQEQENQKPWLEKGEQGLNELGRGVLNNGELVRKFGMSDFKTDPGYQFRMSEGIKALDRSASAGGNLLSGGAMKGITRFGQDTASQEYQNAYSRYGVDQANKYNRLAALSGVGQTTANQLGIAGQNYANNASNIAMGNAANQGNASLASANANTSSYMGIGNALSSGLNQWGQYQGRQQAYDNFWGEV